MPLKHSVQEVSLKNGAKGLFILVPDATSVHYDVTFRAGIHYVRRPEISQVAHLLEHMAFGANREYPSVEAFSQEFTKNGAYSNAHTSTFDLSYDADAAIMEWDRIMNMQCLSITHPVYSQVLLDAEKGNVREELIGDINDEGRMLWQEIARRSGLKRWYDADEVKTIDAVTLDDIKEHYTRTHTTRNMRFVLSGDLGTHVPELIEQLEKWELPEGEVFVLPQDTARAAGLVRIHRSELKNLKFALEFHLNRQINRRELRALNALTHIMTDTLHSRIWGAARTRGICYGMDSWVGTDPTGTSDFGIGGEVSFENAKELFELIIAQLKTLSTDGVTEIELAQAKQHRLGVMQMGLDTVGELASWYESIYYDTGKIDYVDDFPALIEGTTVKEMRDLAKEFLDAKLWVLGGIGDISQAAMQKHYDLFAKELMEG